MCLRGTLELVHFGQLLVAITRRGPRGIHRAAFDIHFRREHAAI